MNEPYKNIIFRIRIAAFIMGMITMAYSEYIHADESIKEHAENSWIPAPCPADCIPHPNLSEPEKPGESSQADLIDPLKS